MVSLQRPTTIRGESHEHPSPPCVPGEVPWVKTLISELDEPARKAGVRIVPSCGYTVPSDLGVLSTVRTLASRRGTGTRSVHGFMQFNGKLSGGTMATGLLLDRRGDEEQAARRDPFLLGGAPPGGQVREEDMDVEGAAFDEAMGCWTAPFWMASISTRVVRRSHELFRQHAASPPCPDGIATHSQRSHPHADPYGNEFGYVERALARDQGVANNLALTAQQLGASPERREALIRRGKLPSPGEGPSAEVRAKSWFRLLLLGRGDDGSSVLTQVSGGDPGYDETSKMVSEAAILLATRRPSLPALRRGWGGDGTGGVLTPAFALGQPLIDELCSRGVSFCHFDHLHSEHEIARELQDALGRGAG